MEPMPAPAAEPQSRSPPLVTEQRETARVEAFSDGIFAIAITLLAFDLKAPPRQESSRELVAALLDQWPSYLSFLLSFLSILIMWVNHHGIFKVVRRVDANFLFANGFLMMLVAAVPFPTSILAKSLNTGAGDVAAAVYAGYFVAIAIAYLILWYAATDERCLLGECIPPERVRPTTRDLLFGVLCYSSATAISLVNQYACMAICMLLMIFRTTRAYRHDVWTGQRRA